MDLFEWREKERRTTLNNRWAYLIILNSKHTMSIDYQALNEELIKITPLVILNDLINNNHRTTKTLGNHPSLPHTHQRHRITQRPSLVWFRNLEGKLADKAEKHLKACILFLTMDTLAARLESHQMPKPSENSSQHVDTVQAP